MSARIRDGVLAPSPDLPGLCECGHPAASHWIGGPPGSRTGCEAGDCTCGTPDDDGVWNPPAHLSMEDPDDRREGSGR